MIFEVTPDHIKALSDTDLRTLVGYLAEQEVIKLGHTASGVTYGGHQNAKDGGIDVRVDLAGTAIKSYVPRSLTGFQVKAQDMPKSAILEEMYSSGALRDAIRELGEAGGAYVIVSSKGSVSDTALSKRKNAMGAAIADTPTAAGIHLDFYDRRRIASWVNQHPGLIPWVRSRTGQPLSGWRPFDDWSSSPSSTDEKYLTDDGIRLVGAQFTDQTKLNAVDGLNKLREILAQPKGIVRLVGLSGVGKTRLVQALFDKGTGTNSLNPHWSVYTDIADDPDPVPLDLLSRIHNLGLRCVLIIDNCGAELHRKLAVRMKNTNTSVSLITIEFDISDDEPENTNVFKLEPASGGVIEGIVRRQYPKLTPPEIVSIAAFSEGNSRVALALASTAQDGDSLANLKDSELFTRLFRQKKEDNPVLLRAAKVCSLVYSFDGETLDGDDAELPILAGLAEQSISEIHGHIAELHRRQLVQKRSIWRAILPHALAHKLAKNALEDIPMDTLKTWFFDKAPERLIKSFSRRLGCLHDSVEAQEIVAEWLGEGGRLFEIETLNSLEFAIFDNIAPVNPVATLISVQQASNRDRGFFNTSNPNRNVVVALLRSLAYESDSFDQAVGLISHFIGSPDKCNNTGDAINIFKSLFYIYLSGTHAPASQRANFLRRLATSEDFRGHAVVLAGLDAMLECSHFSSSYSFDFGSRRRDYGFHPQNWKDVADWYRTAIFLCADLAAFDHLRVQVRSMVASKFRFLALKTGNFEEIIVLADQFAADGGWPLGWAGVRGAVRAAKNAKLSEEVVKLNALAERLKPKSLADRISSYILPDQWGPLDVAEVDFEAEKNMREL